MSQTIAVFAPLKKRHAPDALQTRSVVLHDVDIRHPGRTGVATVAEGYVGEVYNSPEVRRLVTAGALREIDRAQWEAIDKDRRAAIAEPVPAGTPWYVGDLPEYAAVDEGAIESLGLSGAIVQRLTARRLTTVDDLVSAITSGIDLTDGDRRTVALTERQAVVVEQALIDRGLIEPATE